MTKEAGLCTLRRMTRHFFSGGNSRMGQSGSLHPQARTQRSSAVTGIPTEAPAGATECTRTHAPRDPTPLLGSQHPRFVRGFQCSSLHVSKHLSWESGGVPPQVCAPALAFISQNFYLDYFRKSAPPQNRRLVAHYYYLKNKLTVLWRS